MNIRELANRNRNILILVCTLILCLITLSLQDNRLTKVPERIGMSVNASITMFLNNVKSFFVNTVSSIAELRDLRVEYDQLLVQLEQREKLVQNMETLEQENQLLREALNYSQSLEYTHIPAKIIGKDPEVLFSSLMIDKGNRHGIHIGMPVVAFQSNKEALVGKIVEISWNSALIRPLLHPQNFVSARLRRTRYEGLIRGLGSESGSLIMEYLDRNSRNEISVGDEIITSGLQSLYPPNIFIGSVTEVAATSYATSLELEVLPFIDFTRLEHVFVLLETEAKR